MITDLFFRRVPALALLFVCLPFNLNAATNTTDATERLTSLLQGINSFNADFIQSTLGTNGRSIRSQRGVMQIQRPNKFRWKVDSPLPLLVVSDGEDVYVYDADLAQVTISTLDLNQIDTPAVLLSGDTERVAGNFTITESASEDRVLFTLESRNPSSPYQYMKLTFRDAELMEIAMKDSFGQFSIVQLANRSINQPLDADTFTFEIPQNVDVFRNDLP